jgi:hypothetical protein
MPDEKISRVAILKAAEAGGEAARADKSVSDCPYNPADGIGAEALAHAWSKGYNTARAAS